MSNASLGISFASAASTTSIAGNSSATPLTTASCDADASASLTVTGTALPTGLQCNGCYIVDGPLHAVGASPVDATTWTHILSCCQGKQITYDSTGCTAFCVADQGQMQSLWDCYYNADGSLVTGFGGTAAVGCDAQSSVLPVGAGGIGNLTCLNSSSSSASSTTSATMSGNASMPTHTGAAVALQPKSVGKMELVVGSWVLLSLVTGALL